MWKTKLLSNKLGYQAKEICKGSVEGIAWFLLFAYSKNMRGEKLKEKQKEWELDYFKNLQSFQMG